MKTATLGKTGLSIGVLGAGLSEIGSELSLAADDVKQAGDVINRALDAGLTFLDTAACYKVSEELIGLTVAGRRNEFTLATKAGHASGLPTPDWTYETVAANIDRSLVRMKTDRLDLVQLHSCGVDVLDKGDVIRALQDARKAGKVRFLGYSGDNEAAHWAVDSGHFDTLQTSLNLADQRARTTGLLKKAEARKMGIIIKRPIAGGTWGSVKKGRANSRVRGYDDAYFTRNSEMAAVGPVQGEPADPVEFALGFTFSHPEVDVAIVGTKDPRHMESNLRLVNAGLKVDKGAIDEMHRRFDRLGGEWRQLG